MKWVAIGVGVIAAAIAVMWIVGASLPTGHRASVSRAYARPPAVVWSTITDFVDGASWHPGVKQVEILLAENGHTMFRETGDNGAILYEVTERTPGSRLVTRIADPSLPFGGTWTYELVPAENGGSVLTITEDGEVRPATYRFMSKYVFGQTRTMSSYLQALDTKLARS